jgi:hypothetical protein
LGDIAAKPEQEIILADTADAFVQSILKLFESPELRKNIGVAGLRYVNANHAWNALNFEFDQNTFAMFKQ